MPVIHSSLLGGAKKILPGRIEGELLFSELGRAFLHVQYAVVAEEYAQQLPVELRRRV